MDDCQDACFEGRCFWCCLIRVRVWALFAYLEREGTPMQTPDPGEGVKPSWWSGA